MPILNWLGKDRIINHHKEVPYYVLNRKYSYDSNGEHQEDNGSQNMIIHGDNLYALKSLLPKYEGKIKCIYIDPPYNTGKKDWCYNDNVDDPMFQKWLEEVLNSKDDEKFVRIDDLARHDKWLCMIYPRLKLLRELLSENGSIFISIDDNEQSFLKVTCDEIFGSSNFIAQIVWKRKRGRDNSARWFSKSHEYILCYAKNKDLFNTNYLELDESTKNAYKNPDNDSRGPYRMLGCWARGTQGGVKYDYTSNSGQYFSERLWLMAKDNLKKLDDEQKLIIRGDNIYRKMFIWENKGKVPETLWDDTSNAANASDEIKKIFGEIVFDTPKPIPYIMQVLKIATGPGDIILDSFAGSGTTAHAVMALNKLDGGDRKFILIEMLDYADNVTAKRIKSAINGYEDHEPIESSFSYYELGDVLLKNGLINENVGLEAIREYVFYIETKTPYVSSNNMGYYLGKKDSTAYYFCYEADRTVALNDALLNTLNPDFDNYVIYADVCYVPDDFLKQHNIVFKKIPRDLGRF